MGTTTATPARTYAVLGPAERLAAVLDALARRDQPEVDRLADACPRLAYAGADRAFADRLLLALDAAALAAVDLRGLCARVDVLRWMGRTSRDLGTLHAIVAAAAFDEGVRHAGGTLPDEFDVPATATVAAKNLAEAPVELARQGARLAAAELAAVWAGLERFATDRAGVPAETLLAARGLGRVARDVVATLARYPGVRPPPDAVRGYAAVLAANWADRFGQDEGDDE